MVVAFEESKAYFALHAKRFGKKKTVCCFDSDVQRSKLNDGHVSCTCRACPTLLPVVVPTSTGQQQPVKIKTGFNPLSYVKQY